MTADRDSRREFLQRSAATAAADLRSQHEMHLTILDRVQSTLRKSYEADEVLAGRPTAEYDAQ